MNGFHLLILWKDLEKQQGLRLQEHCREHTTEI